MRAPHGLPAGPAAPACALALLLLAGCRDSGLPGLNTPADQARHRAPAYTLYQAADPASDPAAAIFDMAGQPWISVGTHETIPVALLRPVTSAQGLQIYALTWDEPPYTRLYVPGDADGRWRPLARAD